MSLNRVTIIGNLGADPEIISNANNTICTFSLATNEVYGSGNDRKEHTEWHRIVVFGKLAQTCILYLKKGNRVFLEGRLRTSTYQDKEGKQQIRTKIYSNSVKFLDNAKAFDDKHPLSLEGKDDSWIITEGSNLDLV